MAQKRHSEIRSEGRSSAPISKFSAAYWEPKVLRRDYDYAGQTHEVAEWCVRLQHAGRRDRVNLGTNNREEAGRRAARVYRTLKTEGWTAALRLYRPDAEPILNREYTVGHHLELVDRFAPLPVRTFANYSYALRRISADVARERLPGKRQFAHTGAWRTMADKIPVSVLTAQAVSTWRADFIRKHRGNHLAEQRATRSARSYIGNAKSLFSNHIVETLRENGNALPDPLPFAGVRLGSARSAATRYRSTFDAAHLLKSAKGELSENDPDAYAVILLALGAGLRRAEIDGLQWQAVMPDRGVIRVMTTAQDRLKTAESEGDVQCDAGLFGELEATRRPGRTLYVVEPDTERPNLKAAQFYRAQATFLRVTEWLRKHGLMTDKPLHPLRKEFGSVVAASGDIFQAQRQLRHSEIRTTEACYADARKRATLPVAALLNGGPKQEVAK